MRSACLSGRTRICGVQLCMNRLIALGLFTLLVAGATAGSQSSELVDAVDFVLFGPKSWGWTCMVGEPKDLPSYRETADAVIRVRLGGRLGPRLMFDGEEAWDFRDVTVLETFKTIDPQLTPGARLALAEWRGWTAPNTGLISALLAPFDAIHWSTVWILFARRLPGEDAYEVVLGDEGAFQIRDGRIRMRSRSQWGVEWDGQPESKLVDGLR